MPVEAYELPNGLLGLLVCGGWVTIGVGGYLGFQHWCRHPFAEGEKNLAIALLAVIATVNSLLLAFSAVSVWDAYGTADKAVRGEAVTIGALARNLSLYESEQALRARDLLGQYAQVIVEEEWPAMRRGEASDAAWAAHDHVFSAVGHLAPTTAHESALMPEIWLLTNELLKYRRERLYASEAAVPATLWVVVIVGTLLTIGTAYIFPRTPFNTTAVGLLSLSLGLVFFFIVAMDRPFAGTESITPAPIQSALQKMKGWHDTGHAAAPTPPRAPAASQTPKQKPQEKP
ncbi:hypothetical protein AACH06_27005 [Ideonella sp. DXS29W]|uniref:DUF4239 domain-containing protein n=1 Tax=Ideonella lacteola TaxID=2984193 RepID=A0ABU9BWY5_9BURK